MKNKKSLKDLLKTIKDPELPEEFWLKLKTETLRRIDIEKESAHEKRTIKPVIRKPVLVIGALAVLLFSTVLYYTVFQKEEMLYTESVDFYLEEFDSVLSQNLLVSENVIIIENKE